MPKPTHGSKPESGKARTASGEFTARTLGAAVGQLLATGVREIIDWLFS